MRYLLADRGPWFWAGGLALLAALPWILPSSYYLTLVTGVAVWAIVAMSYDLLLGYTGILSLGHALFFGLGTYGVGVLMRDFAWSFLPALAVVILAGALVSVVIGVLSLRVSGVYFAMVTLAFAEFFFLVVEQSDRLGGADGFSGIPTPAWLPGGTAVYYFAAGAALVCFYLARRLVRSPVGTVWQAIRENEQRAASLGYNVFLYKLAALVAAGMFAAAAGGIYAIFLNYAFPSLLSVNTTINLLLMVIIGGSGTLYGAALGAVVVRPVGQLLSSYFDHWLLIFGAIYVLIVLFFPRGFLGTVQDWLGAGGAQTGDEAVVEAAADDGGAESTGG